MCLRRLRHHRLELGVDNVQLVDPSRVRLLRMFAVVLGAGHEGAYQCLSDLRGILVAGLLRKAGPRLADVPVSEFVVTQCFTSDCVEYRRLAGFSQQREELLSPTEGAGVVRTTKAAVRRD